MGEKELLSVTEKAMYDLYQNKEHEAFEQITKLLPVYQKMIQVMLVERNDMDAVMYLDMLKKLVEHYQAQDMLGMADCLKEYAVQMIEHYCKG